MGISIKDIYNDLKKEFEALGFKESKWREANNCFEFWMEDVDRICFFEINYIKEKKLYKFSNIHSAEVIFKDVDHILRKFINLDSKYFGYIFDGTIRAIPNYDSHLGMLFDLPKYLINTKEEFEIAKNIIINYFKQYTIPFFTLVPDLETVNKNILTKLPQSEYSNYIKGDSNFKALIIMKLCNSSIYDEFKTWLIDLYAKLIITDPGRYSKGNEIALKLVEYLDNGQYKELLKT